MPSSAGKKIVSRSSRMIGELGSSDLPMSVYGGRPSADAPVANDATIGPDGEKPSHRLNGVGSIGVPLVFTGIASIGRFKRKPVAVVGSVFRYRSEGHGCRHAGPPSGLHAAFGPVPV